MIILSAHARARSLRRGISRLQEVYVDESYIWEHDSRQWSWFPDDELHAAIAAKASRGDRWSAIYAGTNDGWVEGSLYLAKANKALDTRAIVDADLFEDWFQRYLLSCLTKPSLIILDNASFHRRCDVTLSRMKKAELQAHLTANRVEFDAKAKCTQLHALVKEHADVRTRIEEIASTRGHEVLRLPPYHPELNPIERMWGVTKGAARRLFTIDRPDQDEWLERLNDCFYECTPDVWAGSVDKSWRAAQAFVNMDKLAYDAIAADTGPRGALHEGKGPVSAPNTVAGRPVPVDSSAEQNQAPPAGAAAAGGSAPAPDASGGSPARRGSRKRLPSRAAVEGAADRDESPLARRRKGAGLRS